jgi:peptide/nickel transport system permease protein
VAVYILKRTASFLVTLVAASLFIYFMLNLLGGDPAAVMLGDDANAADIAAIRERLGLNRPWYVQYGEWIGGFFTGDLGASIITGREIAPTLAQRAAVTIPLALFSSVIAITVAMSAGVYNALHYRDLSGAFVSGASLVGIAIPNFWFGILASTYFAVRLGWFPAGGFPGWDAGLLAALTSLFLPAMTIGLSQASTLTRHVRSSVLSVSREDFIRTARSRGLTKRAALWRHGMRNAALPVITVLGIQIGNLISGTVVVENVFFLPGLGRMVVVAVGQRDLLIVQSTLMVIVALVVVINFVTDIIYTLLDPRTKARAA